MKKITRSTAGKTAVFIITVMLIITVIASGLLAIYLEIVDSGRFYSESESDISQEILLEEMNGRAYAAVYAAFDGTDGDVHGYVDLSDFFFRVYDSKGNLIKQDEFGASQDELPYEFTMYYKDTVSGRVVYYTPSEINYYGRGDYYIVQVGAVPYSRLERNLNLTARLVHIVYVMRYAVFAVLFVSLILMIAGIVILFSTAGRKPEDSEIHMSFMDRIPFDVFTVLFIALAGCGAALIDEAMRELDSIFVFALGVIALIVLTLLYLISSAVRIKGKCLIKNTVIFKADAWIINKLKVIFENLPLIWKTVLLVGGITLVEAFSIAMFRYEAGILALLFTAEKFVLIPVILYLAASARRIEKGAAVLAEGNISEKIETRGLPGVLKNHAENLNTIATNSAVVAEKMLKNERMKTELITNVSHDIKTPITSIINYSDLISKEETDNDRIKDYSEVLKRQSEKLKRLVEDLIEASKASTGNLEVNLSECSAGVFLTQASGEYEEKLSKKNLELITKVPEEDIRIMADGRRMWRIFDNLMNNIVKYGKEGTRVYLSLEKKDEKAVITFKNTSEDMLDISEEELMERFVRGDSSRHQEGNGLGLSIARSLTELQGGTLKLSIDGDLFKAILEFPVI